jgi:hypothetical protein
MQKNDETMDNFETVPFTAADGFECNLRHFVGDRKPTKGPVMLVHGAGVRANIFNPPNENTLVRMLAEDGYDVWLENWRGSIDFEPNEWNLDQVALNDHPLAVKKIVEETGAKNVKAIIHCQGSTSFMMSAAMGLVPEVDLIISNAVALHPVVPQYSRFKLNVFVPVIKPFFDYLNPRWGIDAPDLKSKLLRALVGLTHRENDTMVGKFVSFTYGAGCPALWRLENLSETTKQWIQNEFAEVPLTFFQHISKCVARGELVPFKTDARLPESYTKDFRSDARIVLFGGEHNQCFRPDSQRNTYEYLSARRSDYHKLHILDDYSHLDVFLGKEADKNVFPIMLKELNES